MYFLDFIRYVLRGGGKMRFTFNFLSWISNLFYNKTEIDNLLIGHNSSNSAHSDIRSDIQDLQDNIGDAIDFVNSRW